MRVIPSKLNHFLLVIMIYYTVKTDLKAALTTYFKDPISITNNSFYN